MSMDHISGAHCTREERNHKPSLTQILNLLGLGSELTVPLARVPRVAEGHDVGQHDEHVVLARVHDAHLADGHEGLDWGQTLSCN